LARNGTNINYIYDRPLTGVHESKTLIALNKYIMLTKTEFDLVAIFCEYNNWHLQSTEGGELLE